MWPWQPRRVSTSARLSTRHHGASQLSLRGGLGAQSSVTDQRAEPGSDGSGGAASRLGGGGGSTAPFGFGGTDDFSAGAFGRAGVALGAGPVGGARSASSSPAAPATPLRWELLGPLGPLCAPAAHTVAAAAALEALALVALARERCEAWRGAIVFWAIDSDNGKNAVRKLKAGNAYVRYLLAVLTMLQVRYGFRIVPFYVWTKHNTLFDQVGRRARRHDRDWLRNAQTYARTLSPGMVVREFSAMLKFFMSGSSAMRSLALPWDESDANEFQWPAARATADLASELCIPGVLLNIHRATQGAQQGLCEIAAGRFKLSRAISELGGGDVSVGVENNEKEVRLAFKLIGPELVIYGLAVFSNLRYLGRKDENAREETAHVCSKPRCLLCLRPCRMQAQANFKAKVPTMLATMQAQANKDVREELRFQKKFDSSWSSSWPKPPAPACSSNRRR